MVKFSIYLNRYVFAMVDPDQLASEEANLSVSVLFVINSVDPVQLASSTDLDLHHLSFSRYLYQQFGSSNLIG